MTPSERRAGAEIEPHGAHHQRRAGLPREPFEAQVIIPSGIDGAGHRRLRPDDHARPLRSGAPREIFVDPERALGPVGAPLDPLVDVALEHRHAEPRQALLARLGGGDPEADRVRQGDGREAGGGRGVEPAHAQHARERRAAQDAHERERVDAAERGERQQRRVVVLRVAERRPGEAREREGAQVVEGGPEHRHGERRDDARPREESRSRAENRSERRHVAREGYGSDHPDDGRRVAVLHGDDVDPVQDRRMRREPGQEGEPGRTADAEAVEAEQQRGGRDPRQAEAEVEHAPADGMGKGQEAGQCVAGEPGDPVHAPSARQTRRSCARMIRASALRRWS